MSFYQWIYNYDTSTWLIANFDKDGDRFTLCGSSKEYRVVARDGQGGGSITSASGNIIGLRVTKIRFGNIIEEPKLSI